MNDYPSIAFLTGDLISLEALDARRRLHRDASEIQKAAASQAGKLLGKTYREGERNLNSREVSQEEKELEIQLAAAEKKVQELWQAAVDADGISEKLKAHERAQTAREEVEWIGKEIKEVSGREYQNRNRQASTLVKEAEKKAGAICRQAEEHELVTLDREVRWILREKVLRMIRDGDHFGARQIAIREGNNFLLEEVELTSIEKRPALQPANAIAQ